MRLFIAGKIPSKIRKESEKIQKILEKGGVAARWVEPKNLHLTLVFIGELEKEKIFLLKQILQKEIKINSLPHLTLCDLNAFLSEKRAKIVWFSLEEKTDKLKILVENLRQAFKRERIPFHPKPFLPHITLGRLKKPKNLLVIKNKIKIKKISFKIKNIYLIESILTHRGPIYKDLCVFPLLLKQKMIK